MKTLKKMIHNKCKYTQFTIITNISNQNVFFQNRAKLEETKERQKLRSRPKGVSLVGLALGKKLAPEEEIAIVSKLTMHKS